MNNDFCVVARKASLDPNEQGHKLYSKVLTSKPFRLLKNLAGSANELAQIWMQILFKVAQFCCYSAVQFDCINEHNNS